MFDEENSRDLNRDLEQEVVLGQQREMGAETQSPDEIAHLLQAVRDQNSNTGMLAVPQEHGRELLPGEPIVRGSYPGHEPRFRLRLSRTEQTPAHCSSRNRTGPRSNVVGALACFRFQLVERQQDDDRLRL
jgi:hypothetical protein